ncbi:MULTISPECIES: restriction endonuclease subunit S [Flavonifractor]|jgi:type I restriction-modification system, S subunit|uniref:restriction endonuclease subunit S n=1 Tax=Clostridia TaxID=186801 RepID=UPI000822820D|nr:MULTISPECIES: restriction endonuclease subunit S [Flavonifractor]MDB7878133.1 restriction endonuclease subunit S [Flavonifractor plautii]MDB7919012.1 restriction endonuclease subunit S [Flavonifractor plautii]MDB7942995.1 restriction endonuclease subunit S [Flavonifractor plautii]SCJ17707.1 EcoKI restriction-modification system protein HsdS [uncultured Flavonifractor sp.]
MTPAKGYTEMKESGIEWLGKIPNNWCTIRVKYAFRIKKVIAGELGHTVLSVTQRGIKPKDMSEKGQFSLDYSKYQLVDSGDFIMNHMDLLTGWVDISCMNGVTSPDYRVFQSSNPEKYYPGFYRYVFQTCYQQRIFYGLGQGVSGFGRWRLPAEIFLNFYVPVPPYEIQSAIASYLDAQCAKIDEIITQAKASIEDYRQWKASIIYGAVTKGLDPNVEMKDSGVEFIGSIPAHWRITSLKRICQRIKDGSHFSPETTVDGFPYVTARDVHGKGIDYSQCRTVSEENFQNLVKTGCQPQSGDVLLVKDGATTGRVGMMTDDMPCVLLSSVAMLTPKDNVLSEYLMWLIESEVLQFQIRKSMAGSAMPRTTLTKLMAYYAIECPYQEQCMIAEYLDKECLHIDELIAKKESLIADLEIYKKSLIYEVVTGKRRVEDTNQMTIAILSPEIMRYRKALLMLRVLDLLGTGVRGRIQLQKCMFAAECLLNMPFHTQFIRYEHGPYDPDLPNIEEIINAKGWYTVLKGSPVSYQKGKQFEEGLREYMDTFSEIDLKLEKIVDFLRPMKTSQAERVATLLAAWNDFIIDGVSHPTDKEIIGEVVTNWTPNKANPQYSTWQDTLFKMREHRFVPKGSGVHTLQKEA